MDVRGCREARRTLPVTLLGASRVHRLRCQVLLFVCKIGPPLPHAGVIDRSAFQTSWRT